MEMALTVEGQKLNRRQTATKKKIRERMRQSLRNDDRKTSPFHIILIIHSLKIVFLL